MDDNLYFEFCVICDQPLTGSDIEISLKGETRGRAHRRCYLRLATENDGQGGPDEGCNLPKDC